MCEGTFISIENYLIPMITGVINQIILEINLEVNFYFYFKIINLNNIFQYKKIYFQNILWDYLGRFLILFCDSFACFEFVLHLQYFVYFFFTVSFTRDTNKLKCVKKRATCVITR